MFISTSTIGVGADPALKDWLRRGSKLAMIVIIGALVALVVASTLRWGGIIPELARCRQAAREASAANVAMLDQEMSLRAYLLTRDARHLEAYERARGDRARGDDAIRAYAAPVAELAGELHRARSAELRWQDGWARLAVTPGAVPSVREGKALFDAYRREQSVFARALDQRRERLSRQEYLAIGVLGALSLTALLALLLLVAQYQRALRGALFTPVAPLRRAPAVG